MKRTAYLVLVLSFYFVSFQTEVFHNFTYESKATKSEEWGLNADFE